MTLIVTAMIGNYSVIAADRKQSNLFTILIGKSFLKDTTKIEISSNFIYTGTGRVSILNKIKKYFKISINNNKNIIPSEIVNFLDHHSDFNGLNFVSISKNSEQEFIHQFYFQDINKYIPYTLNSKTKDLNNKYNVITLNPADINFKTSIYIAKKEIENLESFEKEDIVNSFKKIFKHFSVNSKFVSSEFDIVFLSNNEISPIINIKN